MSTFVTGILNRKSIPIIPGRRQMCDSTLHYMYSRVSEQVPQVVSLLQSLMNSWEDLCWLQFVEDCGSLRRTCDLVPGCLCSFWLESKYNIWVLNFRNATLSYLVLFIIFLLVTVVIKLVVTSKGYKCAKSNSEWPVDLCGGVYPHLDAKKNKKNSCLEKDRKHVKAARGNIKKLPGSYMDNLRCANCCAIASATLVTLACVIAKHRYRQADWLTQE